MDYQLSLRSSFAACGIALWLLCGCGQKTQSTALLDTSELLELIQDHKPGESKNYVEQDMGRFRVSHALATEGQVLVQFHLYGLVPPQRKEKLAALLPKYEKRVRDAVISLVQRTETEHLTDASLAYFKTELVSSVNEVLQDRLLSDVVFSDFSIDPVGATAWSSPAAEAKPKEGGHGGGHGGHGSH